MDEENLSIATDVDFDNLQEKKVSWIRQKTNTADVVAMFFAAFLLGSGITRVVMFIIDKG